MSVIGDIENAFDFGGMSLAHIKTVASSVKTEPMVQMAKTFDHGHAALSTQHTELSQAVTKVVGGWKGKAADAASTSVLNTATTSRESGYAAQSSSSSIHDLVSTVKAQQSKINAVPQVDTSFQAALNKTGGPVAAVFNPGAVVTAMAQAQGQANQNKAEAADHLTAMNKAGADAAAAQKNAFPAIPVPTTMDGTSLPATISVPPVGAGGTAGGSGNYPGSASPGYVPPSTTASGPGSSTTITTPSTVAPVTPVNPSGPTTPSSAPVSTVPVSPGAPSQPGTTLPVATPVAVGPGYDPTSPTSAAAMPTLTGPQAGGNAAGTAALNTGLPSSVGVSAGAVAGGGAALLAAGGLSTVGRGAAGLPGAGSGNGGVSGTEDGPGRLVSSREGATGRGGLPVGRGGVPGAPGEAGSVGEHGSIGGAGRAGLAGEAGGRAGGLSSAAGQEATVGRLGTGEAAESSAHGLNGRGFTAPGVRAGESETTLRSNPYASGSGLHSDASLHAGPGGSARGFGPGDESTGRYGSGYGSETGRGAGYGSGSGYGSESGHGYGSSTAGTSGGFAGDGAESAGGRGGSYGHPGGSGYAAGEGAEPGLRGGPFGTSSGGSLSAGEGRGMYPGGGMGGARPANDDDELNKRPDYLVETDDIWGDGRLAAPPVLG